MRFSAYRIIPACRAAYRANCRFADGRAMDVPAGVMTALLAGICFGSRKLVKGGLSPSALIVIAALCGIVLYTWR